LNKPIEIDLGLKIGGTKNQEGAKSENCHAQHLKLLNESSCLGRSPGLPLRRFHRERVTTGLSSDLEIRDMDSLDGALARSPVHN